MGMCRIRTGIDPLMGSTEGLGCLQPWFPRGVSEMSAITPELVAPTS